MTVFQYPPLDAEPWPTLGPAVCQWIEENLCHGPGDLLGRDVVLDDEVQGLIGRMYELHPPTLERRKNRIIVKDSNPQAGKRRFQRCAVSVRKGSSKTERAAWITAAEMHRDAPVRFAGWVTHRGVVVPEGQGVTDPYIPMISYTEEQTEELAYGALRRILSECRIASDFDIGYERIMRIGGDGKAEAVAGSPDARDGARTTFQHADETHRFTLDKQREAWNVMLANMAKRPMADPWALETTTAPEPGAGSVAESTMEHAKKLAETGKKSRLFFFHRQASDSHDLDTDAGLRAAIVEASGPYVAKWSDIDRILDTFSDPDADRPYLERVWLNRPVQAAGLAFDVVRYRELVRPGYMPADGATITLGFDGGRFDDNSALEGTEVETGFQWKLGVWEPDGINNHDSEVDGAVRDAFERWNVARFYADPPKWESWIATWAGRYGEKRVSEWWTNRRRQMAMAIRSFVGAIAAGDLSHDGDRVIESHIANARKLYTNLTDEQGVPLWILRKERPDSPKKIDGALAAILSWEARNDAVAAGFGVPSGKWLLATV